MLGAILYELLTGRPPFKAETALETVLQVLHEEPVPPRRLQPKVPRDLETICLKCLHKQPQHRYASAGALADDLGHFLRGEPILAQPTPWWRRTAKWARRRPALAALLAVIALAASGLVGVGLWYNVQLQQEVQQRAAKEAEAREQQRLAAARYREARVAMRRMLVRLEQKELAEVPRLLELRLGQLEDALAFYQSVLREQNHPDAAVRFDTAQAYLQAARIEQLLGKAMAQEHAEQAEKLLRELTAEAPMEMDYQVGLAACLNLLVVFDNAAGNRFRQAETFSREAIRRCETVLQRHPDAAPCLYELADAHRSLGNLYFEAGRREEAAHHYMIAHDLGQRLMQAHPEDRRYRNALAEFCSRLGHVLPAERAEPYFRQAEEQFQRLIQDYPEDLSFKLRLAAAYNNWGNLWRGSRPEVAIELFVRGIHLMEPVHRQEPQYAPARTCLLSLHGARAYALSNLERYADAVSDWDEVVKLATGPYRLHCRAERATDLARAGDYGRAVAEARAVAAEKESSAETFFFAACACSLSIDAAQRNKRLTPSERDRLVEEYGASAVQMLSQARAAGLFRNRDLVKILQDADSELGPLQARTDFQKLRAEIEAEGR